MHRSRPWRPPRAVQPTPPASTSMPPESPLDLRALDADRDAIQSNRITVWVLRFEHDLVRKPVSTFRGHAQKTRPEPGIPLPTQCEYQLSAGNRAFVESE